MGHRFWVPLHALLPLCGFWWLVGVSRCGPYNVRFLLWCRVLGACAAGGRAVSAGVWAVLVPTLWHALPACGAWCPPLCPLSLRQGPSPSPFLAQGWYPAPVLCRSRCPVPVGATLSFWALPCPLSGVSLPVPCPPLACALSLPGVVVAGWGEGLLGAHGPRLGVGGLLPPAECLGVFGRQRPWTASRRRASHAACRMVASGAALLGLAGVRVRISSKVCTMCTPFRLPAPPAQFTQRRSSGKAGADHQARWTGAWRVAGCKLEFLEWREEDVDMGRRWQAWRCLGNRERRGRGLGLEDAYGRRGKREARCCTRGERDAGMERRWRAWRRPGERERRWRGMGVEDAYGQRGEREARYGSWWEGHVDMGRTWLTWRRPGERQRRLRGLVVEDVHGRRGERNARCSWRGEGDGDMGRRWRAWWRPGERERRRRGPGGSWWRLGEQERRE